VTICSILLNQLHELTVSCVLKCANTFLNRILPITEPVTL